MLTLTLCRLWDPTPCSASGSRLPHRVHSAGCLNAPSHSQTAWCRGPGGGTSLPGPAVCPPEIIIVPSGVLLLKIQRANTYKTRTIVAGTSQHTIHVGYPSILFCQHSNGLKVFPFKRSCVSLVSTSSSGPLCVHPAVRFLGGRPASLWLLSLHPQWPRSLLLPPGYPLGYWPHALSALNSSSARASRLSQQPRPSPPLVLSLTACQTPGRLPSPTPITPTHTTTVPTGQGHVQRPGLPGVCFGYPRGPHASFSTLCSSVTQFVGMCHVCSACERPTWTWGNPPCESTPQWMEVSPFPAPSAVP